MRSLTVVAVLLVASACAATVPQIEGQWRLESVIDGGSVQRVPDAERHRLSANLSIADGSLRTGAACNIAEGSYKYHGESRTLEGRTHTMTLMGCVDPAEYEYAIVGMLSSGPIDVMLLGETMLWTSGDRTLRFTRTGEA